jgi:hypothetical protein
VSKLDETPERQPCIRDQKWARRLVVKQHLDRDRAEDELDQLQQDFEAVLRQCRDARERKYDLDDIADLDKQLETANRTIRALSLFKAATIKFLSARDISPLT